LEEAEGNKQDLKDGVVVEDLKVEVQSNFTEKHLYEYS
jgi:hypothetical protein